MRSKLLSNSWYVSNYSVVMITCVVTALLRILIGWRLCDLMSPQHDYEATKSWYRNLARDHRDLVRYNASIGKSVEGRDMPAVHITAKHNSGRKKIYFQCQIHARESYRQTSTLTSYPTIWLLPVHAVRDQKAGWWEGLRTKPGWRVLCSECGLHSLRWYPRLCSISVVSYPGCFSLKEETQAYIVRGNEAATCEPCTTILR